MKYIFIVFIVAISTSAIAEEIQHFNTDIFGMSANENVSLLSPSVENAIKPTQILTDINEDGIFYASTIIYPESLTLEVARNSINKLYKKYEVENFANNPAMGIWRNEDKKFVIQLSMRNETESKMVQVIYISLNRQ